MHFRRLVFKLFANWQVQHLPNWLLSYLLPQWVGSHKLILVDERTSAVPGPGRVALAGNWFWRLEPSTWTVGELTDAISETHAAEVWQDYVNLGCED